MGEEVYITGTEHREEIDCCSLSINGAVTIDRDVLASRVTITGSAVVGNDVETRDLSVSGSLRISGQLQTKDATVSGFLSVEGETSIERLVSSGELDLTNLHAGEVVGNDFFAEEVSADVFQLTQNGEDSIE